MSKVRILIVEDEHIAARDLQRRLSALGYEVLGILSSGEEAVDRIPSLVPELVLIDVRLGGTMAGLEAADEIHRRFGTPVVHVRTNADNDTLRRTGVAPQFGCILEPFDEREIRTAIETALHEKKGEGKPFETKPSVATIMGDIADPVIATDVPGTLPTEQTPDASQYDGNGETVLVVEDEEGLLEILQLMFEAHGYSVLTARDGVEALDVYKQEHEKIAVVLSDMGLPKVGGWQVFEEMKKLNPAVKSILASGYMDPKQRQDLINIGAMDFIQKPYNPADILRRIRNAIDGKNHL